ncbi:Sensor histidine kinase LiaS [Nonomuraea coxensis DSM 45129]|uniref:Sensor histidine kinase LiaS n=1 Tax=Nonomuraea coxensis DSM 45129 TaxID=1122611 RepID=A0ABX8TRD9_9ACTN|nr:sensor histidine kinase [Nonomuraea coxensis]QYC37834.1 Sensor histidine kinase LiaS [Nonomuraea coxensis DSM 45129]
MFRYHAGGRDAARTAASAVAVLAVVSTLTAIGLDMSSGPAPRPQPLDWEPWSSCVPGIALAVAGFVLAARLPGHLMTWLLIGGGASAGVNALGATYAVLSLNEHGGRLPLTAAALFVGARMGPLLNLVTPLVLLFFPDGRLPSPRWRFAAWVAVGAAGLSSAVFMVVPWRLLSEDGRSWPGIDLPLPAVPDEVWTVLMAAAPALLAASTAVPVVVFVRRFRGSHGVLRAQLRWMALAAVLNGVLILLPLVVDGLPQDLTFVVSLLAIAGAVLIAVGRYRLYDIDPLLNWTLLYGGLAMVVVIVDVPIFVGLGALINEPVAAVLAATAVAVVYAPLRDRARRWVNRVLTGRAEPYEVVSALARRLEEATNPEGQLLETVRAICLAYGSPYARVELDKADGGMLAAEHGTAQRDVVVLPIAYRGDPIGRLSLVPRGWLAESDQRLLADVVRQTAAAVRAIELTEELQQSRTRLVSGVAEERRRLRRDLHDGLGPTLAAAALKVEAAGNLMPRDPGTAREVLGQVRADLATVIEDVRRLVHDLRPPALDQWGLAEALRKEAARFADGGLDVRVDVRGELDGLPAATEVAAYRIVCEALVNVSRHAAAESCEIRLTTTSGELEVEVVDDGRGVEPGAAPGVGLIAMRERARELGGRCAVTLRAGGGTRVHAVLPSGGVA